jgi:AraC-like DNA-binding protein
VSGSVSALLVRPVIAMLLDRPTALDAMYRATDLTPEIVADNDARITPAQFCVAWAELVRLTNDPTIALRMAAAIPPGAFGIVEYLCRTAPTLEAALRQWVRYLNLLDDAVEIGLVVEGDAAYLRVLAESEAPAPASHELCFALVHHHARTLSAEPFRPLAVDLAHPVPGGDTKNVKAYEAWFDAPVRFGAKETQLVIPKGALDAKLVTADATLFGILARAADELQSKTASDAVLTAQVKRALQKALRDGETEIEPVAKRLGLSARSLQRRLKDEGTSFQAVREDTRRDLARHYLDLDLSISEISFLLGFSEPSAFFRAFKRWTGTTPIESRKERRASGQLIGARGH